MHHPHFHLSLLIQHFLMVKLIYLMSHTHFSLLLLYSLSLHLCDSGSLHLLKSFFHWFLAHPHFVWSSVILSPELFMCFTINLILMAHITLLGNFISLIEFLLNQPLFHLVNSRIMHAFLSFCIAQEFLSNLSLWFCN